MNETKGLKVFSLGLQHVLAMYAGAILVPLLVGRALNLSAEQLAYLVSIDLLTCGIATWLQARRGKHFGIGLPAVLGTSFVAVTPMMAIGPQYGIPAIYGSIIVAGIFIILSAVFFSKIIKLFPPVVIGSVVTIIGISLVPTGIKNMAGGSGSKDFGSPENLALAFGVCLLILVLNRFTKGFVRSLSVLIGIIAGTLIAGLMGKINFTAVKDASWFHLPQPFYFGTPTFEIGPIVTMMIVGIVIMIESTGVFFALSKICDQPLDEKDLVRGYRSEGLAFVLGGILNAFPYSTFAQNVGLVQLSRVKTTNVVVAAGGILVFLGLIPKIAALATVIPNSVLGGATIVLFGMVISSGIKMLQNVDFSNQYNLLIVACSVSLGLGVTAVPDLFAQLPQSIRVIVGDGIITGSLAAILLNVFFNLTPRREACLTPPAQEAQI
ncbi:nucleobase:cation symporter-2 family protein [Paenibacillus sp. JX-17]|uniref:Nucleobase:cation symporter-2 family protein n=1 Tax=Paenibacillus lacisoli TaxID=3064525 RepID=A0ABT9CFL6_9BACL|nr:nucleobase:cation symporter-2 family protein [Paenibacillus sp. JX-17]MDO7908073.1 nucleobase:cation symporter-2 family protein [Paenibacillus sp. JX-17]